jgi:hypothetical protein
MDRNQDRTRTEGTGRREGVVRHAGQVEDVNAVRVSRRGAGAEPIPTMTTDNPDAGAVAAANEMIKQVRHGMRVVDATGDEIGNVEAVKMGDPGAATVEVDTPAYWGLIAAFFGGTEPDVPEPFRSRLLRFGYVKVDGKGWIDTDRYITTDVIGDVSGDTVTLTVDKDRLLQER